MHKMMMLHREDVESYQRPQEDENYYNNYNISCVAICVIVNLEFKYINSLICYQYDVECREKLHNNLVFCEFFFFSIFNQMR